MANIKKIKLSNGTVYSIFDEGAIRLNSDNILVTGNTVVDNIILGSQETECKIYITQIDDVSVVDDYEQVLVRTTEGQVAARSKDNLLEDIGGISYSMNDSTGVLSLQFGRQTT